MPDICQAQYRCLGSVLGDEAIRVHQYDGTVRVCTECATKAVVCSVCNKSIWKDQRKTVKSKIYCSKCFFREYHACYICRRGVLKTEAMNIDGRGAICDRCFNANSFYLCEKCNGVHYWGDDCDLGRNHSYGYVPTFIIRGDFDKEVTMGFELEVQCYSVDPTREEHYRSRYFADIIEPLEQRTGRFVYCTRDSSIQGGFEVTSHPFTLTWLQDHQEILSPIFGLRRKKCRAYGANTCGLHIHLGTSYFSDLHLYKMQKFYFDNPEFIFKSSGRKDIRKMQNWAPLITGRDKYKRMIESVKRKRSGRNAVGFKNNETINTVEIRIFQSTLGKAGFMKSIEFAHASYAFTKIASIKELYPENFGTFVASKRKRYPYLFKWLEGGKK